MGKLAELQEKERRTWKRYKESGPGAVIAFLNYSNAMDALEEEKEATIKELTRIKDYLEELEDVVDDDEFETIEKLLLRFINRVEEL